MDLSFDMGLFFFSFFLKEEEQSRMGGDTRNKNKMPVTSRARHWRWQRGSSLFGNRRKRRHLNSKHSENIRHYDHVYATYMLLWLICILLHYAENNPCDYSCYCRRSSSESLTLVYKKKKIRCPQQQCLHLRYLKIYVTQLKKHRPRPQIVDSWPAERRQDFLYTEYPA